MSAQPESLLRFEPMTVNDLAEVSTIENSVYPYPWTLGNFRESLDGGHSCWMCRYAGETLGYAILMSAAGEAHVLNITVVPQWQHQGYGTQLLRHLIRIAKAQAAEALFLEVRPSNQMAQHLYFSFGFRAIGVRRAYYPAPAGREDAIVMELRL